MFRVAYLLIIAVLVASCAGGPKVVDDVDPFKTSRDDFQGTTRIVALADVYLPDGMPEPGPIQENIHGLIESHLREERRTVVYPQHYTAIWEKLEEASGGFIDTETGERKHSEIAVAMAKTLDQLGAGFTLDAIMIPTVVVVEAPFGGGRAAWDGTTQAIKTGSVMKGFWAGSPDGTLGALSLRLTVLSAAGAVLYERAGGIEVLSKLEGKEFILVPRQELFTDQDRIEKAVAYVLDPLFD